MLRFVNSRLRPATSSLAANGLAMLAARLLVPAFSFAINVGIARVYGAETLGVYVQLIALVVVFQTMAGAGIPLLLTRDLAAHPDETPLQLRRARSFALASGGLATLAFAAYAQWLLPADRSAPAFLLALSVLPSARIAIQEAFFMARRAHHRVTLVAFAENALKLALAAGVFAFGGGILGLCAAITLARCAALGAGEWMMRGAEDRRTERPTLADALAFGRAVAPFAVLFTLSMVYFRVDVLLVAALRDAGDTGFYGAALALFSIALLVPSSAMSALYPRLAAMFRSSHEGYARATLVSVELLTLGIVPLSLALICFADRILTTAYGDPFLVSAPVLRLLAATLPLQAVNGAFGHALQAGKLQASMLRIVAMGLAAHVVMLVVLVPRLGIEGAAVSLVVSSALVTVGTARAFHSRVAPIPLDAGAISSLLAGVGPIVLTLLAPSSLTLVAGLAGLVWLALGLVVVVRRSAEYTQLARAMRTAVNP
ncbi:MAG: oligosaccharide flippase family protein [bacterium]|nr:oligosaccharide flippase family protein [bacterium]